jgi:hypothetical protein
MEIVTIVDVFEQLAAGQRSGFLKKDLRKKADVFLNTLFVSAREKEQAVAEATQQDAAAVITALEQLAGATDPLMSGHDVVAQLAGLDRRTGALLEGVTNAVETLREFSDIDFPAGLLPESASTGLGALATAAGDSEALSRDLLAIGLRGATAGDQDILRSLTEIRLWTLNSLVISNIAAVTPDVNASSLADASAFRAVAENRSRSLRNSAKGGAERLASDSSADPIFATSLWIALDVYETWVRSDAIAALNPIAAAATGAVQAGHADEERLSRDAALAYDAIRLGLAYSAGIRNVLLAYAVGDLNALSAFAGASDLQLSTATLDLPRKSLAEAAAAGQDELVEISGIVREADIIVGGPTPRSTLVLGSEAGTQIRVLVPFTAVDSFGITSGVWVQVRGPAHPNGKDGIPGPVVQVGRIKRAEAAAISFEDALVHLGRREFELRPGQLDLVGGRLAGSEVTANEIGLRRSVGG